MHYLTLQIVDWIDVFTRQTYRDIVIDSLNYCQQNKGFQIFGFVIMSNHIHLIANSPVRAGFVRKSEEYIFKSAYVTGNSLRI